VSRPISRGLGSADLHRWGEGVALALGVPFVDSTRVNRVTISVSMTPGPTAFTLMPLSAYSRAAVRVRRTTPCLDAV
jgi:hypothetical protein